MTGAQKIWTAAAPVGLLLAVFAVYLPYLNNPPVFDDATFFSGEHFYVFAAKPWEYGVRGLPYFTLAFVQTVFGQMWVHRLLSGVLHAACAWMIFLVTRDLLIDAETRSGGDPGSPSANWSAFVAALAFAVHPVAVYSAGYLVQRTSVLALLFSLLCVRSLRQGLVDARVAPVLAAALWYTLAVLSKEHALLVPAVAAVYALAVGRLRGVAVTKRTALFLAVCLPVALAVLLPRAGYVAAPYEPHLNDLQGELFTPQTGGSALETWFTSASIQAGLFFKYALLWFWPDTSQMAIDLRVDFGAADAVSGAIKIALFAAAGVVAGIALLRGRSLAVVAAFGVAYVWLTYLIEIGAIRFQEPFVLYRSYLWAPGYAVLLAAGLRRLPARLTFGFAAVALPLLVHAAYNRLDTFRSSLALWNDAVAALPKVDIGGARRIYYNRGRALYLAGRYAEALHDAEIAVRLAPQSGPMRIARGAALLELGRLQEAARDFEAAIRLSPEEQRAHILLASVWERLGEHSRADEVVRRAETLGHKGSIAWLRKFRDDRARRGIGTKRRGDAVNTSRSPESTR